MLISREGNLRDSDITTGDVLSLELERTDVESLANPQIRQSSNRIMGIRDAARFMTGWAMEDKVHLLLREPLGSLGQDRVVDLSLDPGGDLYFMFWLNRHLAAAPSCLYFADINDVLSPVNGAAARVEHTGLRSLKIFHVDALTATLKRTGQL